MDKIPLRTYLKEIENLIDKGDNDQAIAHCRHILKAYPKNLATYRLLGKAYLECHRYGDAADVFQRVLSSAPDDFVSHVGMSIIREDESNQDAAIWHMERAFEIQPYNSAIQDELRRLYGRRDGLEPPKVRLTRGALARMYARGNLYQQAIGELRAALAEDPKRSDLQVLLARMYFMAGQKVEAVETCSTLLKKLPYCLEANRIISAILPETERKEETQVYRERVMSLDPYLVLASPYETTSDGVRDQVVVIEKLDYQEGQFEESAQPAWAASLGVTFDEFKPGEEPVPDWLQAFSDGPARPSAPSKGLSTEQTSPTEPPSPEATFLSEDAELIPSTEGEDELPSWISFPDQPSGKVTPSASGEIPEWMKEAGWEASTGATESGLPDFDYPEAEEIDEPEIEKGELPSWLQSLAPAESGASSPLSDEDALLASMPWLKESASDSEQPQGSEAAPDWLEDLGAEPGQDAAEAPEWLKELDEAETVAEAEAEAEGAGWVGAAKDELVSEPFEDVAGEIESQGEMQEPVVFPFEGAESLQLEAVEDELPGKVEPGEELPEWLKELDGETGSGEPAELEAEAGQGALDLGAVVTSEIVHGQETETDEELPDWLKEVDQEEVGEQPHTALESTGGEPVDAELESVEKHGIELLESDRSLDGREDEPDLTEVLEEKDALLKEMEPESPAGVDESGALFSEAQFEAGGAKGEELPEWVRELEAEQPEESLVEAEDSALAFEESTPAEDLPEWMQEIMQEESVGRIEEAEIEEQKDFEGTETSEEIPDWLREFGKEGVESKLDEIQIDELGTGELLEEGEAVPGEDIPAWLRDLEEENLALAEASVDRLPASEILPVSEEQEPIGDEQDWLQIIGEKPLSGGPSNDLSDIDNPDYSPEDLEALLADTQPVRVGREEPAVPFNEILEEIDSGTQTPETGKGDKSPAEYEEFILDESIDEIEGVVPGVFGAALAAADVEDMLPGEELILDEAKQILPSTEGERPLPPFEVDDQDAGMAWLESLAAKQGISEEELFTSPEERPEAFPFADESEGIEGAEPIVHTETAEEMEVIEAAFDVPEEIEQMGSESEESLEWVEGAAQAEGNKAESVEAPDWLKELYVEDQEHLEIETELGGFGDAVDTSLDVGGAAEHVEVSPVEEFSVEEVPDWLREVQSEAEEELSQRQPEPGGEQEHEVEDSDAAMAWLESLAAKQGVPEDELFTKPEDRLETPPVWVEEQAETDVTEEVPLPVDVGANDAPFETVELQEQLFEAPELEEVAPVELQGEIEVGAVHESGEVEEVTTAQPAQIEEPELPEWLSDSDEAEVEEVDWAMPVEPVKAALREPRPGTAPLTAPPSQPVDINKASLVDLETLPGVGFILAQNILTYRDAFGPYKEIEDLVRVPGITPGILAEIRVFLSVPPEQQPGKEIEPELLDEAQASLLVARNKLAEGDVAGTAAQYSKLVKNPELLPEIIRDLKEALYRFPVDIGLWQTLGDAYMRSNQLAEALEAYTKAEELLR